MRFIALLSGFGDYIISSLLFICDAKNKQMLNLVY